MLKYAIRRLLIMIPVLLGLAVVVFFYIRLLPGDPVTALLGDEGSPEIAANLRKQLGLDRPLLDQFFLWVGHVVQGDFGISYRSRTEIAPLVLSRLPASLELALGATLLGLLIALPAGIIAGLRRNSRFDYIFSLIILVGYSTPVFWTGYLLILLLSINFRLFPTFGYTPFWEDPLRSIHSLFLPALTLGLFVAPLQGRVIRTAIIETMQEKFIFYARAKGLKDRYLFWRYIFRHAVITFVVVMGLQLGRLLGGSVVVEEMFAWPGMGGLLVRSVGLRDYLVVQAALLTFAALLLTLQLAVEILHAWLDPRVRIA